MLTKELLKGVSSVLPAVDKKSREPFFTSIEISGKQLRATNGTLFIRVSLNEDTGVEVSVPGHLLSDVLKSVSCESVELKEEKGSLFVKGEGVATEILGTTSVAMVGWHEIFQEPSDVGWEGIPKGLIRALSLCSGSCCDDAALHVLTGVHVEDRTVWGCDRYRISKCTLPEESKCQIEAIIPVSFIDLAVKNENGLEAMSIANNTIAFSVYGGKMVIAAGLIMGNYPSLSTSMINTKGLPTIELPADFSKTLKAHNVMLKGVDEKDRKTKVGFGSDQISLYSISEDTGNVMNKVDCEIPKELVNTSFMCNPIHFAKIVNSYRTLVFHPGMKTLAFISDGFVHQIKTT